MFNICIRIIPRREELLNSPPPERKCYSNKKEDGKGKLTEARATRLLYDKDYHAMPTVKYMKKAFWEERHRHFHPHMPDFGQF